MIMPLGRGRGRLAATAFVAIAIACCICADVAHAGAGQGIGVVVFTSEAESRFGKVGSLLARQVQASLRAGSQAAPALLALDSLPAPSGHKRTRTDLDWERGQAIRLGRAANVDTVIYGRVLAIAMDALGEKSHSGKNSVLRGLQANNRRDYERLTAMYTVHSRTTRIRTQVCFGVAECASGRTLFTELVDRSVLDESSWADLSGDPAAYPANLIGTPRTAPVIRPDALARRACEELGPAIAARARTGASGAQ